MDDQVAFLKRILSGSWVVRCGLMRLRLKNTIRVDMWAGKTMRL